MCKEAEGLCWLWGDVMSANSVSPAEQLPLRQHKHRPSLIPHLTLCRNISQWETVCPQDFRGVKSIFAFHECKNKLIRGNRCMLNLDIPTVELFMQWFHTEVACGNALHRKSLRKGFGLKQGPGQLPEQKELAQVMFGLFQKWPTPAGLHWA